MISAGDGVPGKPEKRIISLMRFGTKTIINRDAGVEFVMFLFSHSLIRRVIGIFTFANRHHICFIAIFKAYAVWNIPLSLDC